MSADIVKRNAAGNWEAVETCTDGFEAQARCLELNEGKEPGEGGHWVRGSNGMVWGPCPKRTTEPMPGTWAAVARSLVEDGLMDGDEADRWKDEMKERDW